MGNPIQFLAERKLSGKERGQFAQEKLKLGISEQSFFHEALINPNEGIFFREVLTDFYSKLFRNGSARQKSFKLADKKFFGRVEG